jgi:hypothetical protein
LACPESADRTRTPIGPANIRTHEPLASRNAEQKKTGALGPESRLRAGFAQLAALASLAVLRHQVGYGVGMEICRIYHEAAADQAQALRNIYGAYLPEHFDAIVAPYVARMSTAIPRAR